MPVHNHSVHTLCKCSANWAFGYLHINIKFYITMDAAELEATKMRYDKLGFLKKNKQY